MLIVEFKGYQTTYVDALPPADEVPLFAEHDSLYRLLLAPARRPGDRFRSAEEMRVQLLGVLREVVADDDGGHARSTPSTGVRAAGGPGRPAHVAPTCHGSCPTRTTPRTCG